MTTGRAKRRLRLAALAGGGITAATMLAPGPGGALAAEAPTGTTSTGASTTTTPTSPQASTPSTASATTPTPVAPPPTTSTQTTAPAPTPTSTAQAPQPRVRVRPHSSAPRALVQHGQQGSTGGTAPVPGPGTPTTIPAPPAPAPAPALAGRPSSTAIAPAPQLAAVQSSALAALTSASSASMQALSFYRIPLFLLPIYQAAAVQYGVPWQVLAAINEVETDFGTDQSVSSAGAVGWMQFMPETWLQYGVDALNAGYADPYNPVDAVFAAARYLHVAGASSDLRGAIFAYNHSEAYVESVLLRARLFSSYPATVIGTLTGLIEGTLPVADGRLSPTSPVPVPASAPTPQGAAGPTLQSVAGATGTSASGQTSATAPSSGAAASGLAAALPGSTPAPSPAQSAAQAQRALDAPAPSSQLSELLAKPRAPVVAVEDGRIVGLGVSRKIGAYIVLRDTYGDVFTYAGLGSVASAFRIAKFAQLQVPKGSLSSGEAAAPTLHIAARIASVAAAPRGNGAATSGAAGESAAGEAQGAVAGGKVRVFAHPGNPDAVAAARLRSQSSRRHVLAAGWAALSLGAVVPQGTVLGRLGSAGEGKEATLRFAIRPDGSQSAIDPRAILENWSQLSAALHPKGAKAGAVLAGATASDAFLLSAPELERSVLADPGIQMGACDRSQVAAGKVSRHALALLVFLSRSGLKPTVGQLRCGVPVSTPTGTTIAFPPAGTLDIAAINGVPIAGHQGAGSVTDATIRTLLTADPHYAPKRIVSLMAYPGAPSTVAQADHSTFVQLQLAGAASATPATRTVAGGQAPQRAAAARTSATAPAGLSLDTFAWQRLIGQIAGIPQPSVALGPTASAIRDARP